jgi:hypothetical protein
VRERHGSEYPGRTPAPAADEDEPVDAGEDQGSKQ